MYTREELKQLKKEFWEGFGVFCGNHPVLGKRKQYENEGCGTEI